MKKYFDRVLVRAINFILILLLIITSCSDKSTKKPLYKLYSLDFKKYQQEGEIEIIDLDSVRNFSELRKRMGELTCKEKVSGLRFELNDTLYHLTGFSPCPTHAIGCYFRRNLLFIRNDSIIIEFGKNKEQKPVSYLKTELNEIMSKTYNYQYKENKVKPALIHFYVEDKYPVLTIKRVLKEIAKEFELISSENNPDFFKYDILFDIYDFTNSPPPPLPQSSKLKESDN